MLALLCFCVATEFSVNKVINCVYLHDSSARFPTFHRPDRLYAAARLVCLLITLLITVLLLFFCFSSGCICVFVCVLNCLSCCHYAPPANGSLTRGGSTPVRGRVRSPHMAKLQAASVPIAYGSCAPRAGTDKWTDRRTDRGIA